MKYLLDTNIISEIRKKEKANPNVMAWAVATDREATCTSVIVIAEIRKGIELLRRYDQKQADMFDRWYARIRADLAERVLPISERVAEAWAIMNVPNPLPLMDGLLAATAKVHGLTIVTRNVSHFERAGVAVFNPFEKV